MFRTLIAGTVALVIGLAFLVTAVIDDLAPAATDIITVWDSDASQDGAFQRLVRDAAAEHDMTVLKEERTDSGTGVRRTEYVANRGAAQGFGALDQEVSGFDPTLITSFRPLTALPDNQINGMYVTDAGSVSARAFATSLSDSGVVVTVNPLSPLFVSLWIVSEVPAIPLTGCLVVAMVIGVAGWQASRRNAVAIAASHGRGVLRSASLDAVAIAARAMVCGLVGTGLAATVLSIVNGGARLGTFVVTAGLGIVASAVVLAFATLTAAVVPASSITRSIAGERPWRTLLSVAMVGNVVALALASGAAASTWRSVELARHDASERGMWRTSLDDVQLRFQSSIAELDAAEVGLAGVYTRLDATGSAILADHLASPDPGKHGPDDGNVLIVNAQYLREQPVRSPTVSRVIPSQLDPEALTLLVPEGVRLTGGERRAWRDFLSFQRENSTDPGAIPTTIDIDEVRVEQGRVFDYATDDIAATSTLESPVIAVLPAATVSMSENYLTSNMTTGEIVFTDEAALRSDLEAHGLTRSVATIEPLRDFVTYRSAVIDRELRYAVAALVVVFLVLLWSAALTGRAITMIHSRRTMIGLLHGRRLSVAAAPVLALPLTIIAATTVAHIVAGSQASAPAVFASAAVDILFVSVTIARRLHKEELR
ncbi:hypothetical protein GA0004736_1943 [Curtobacterium sp. 9128]|uniref:hypothetical protein n=1 Tax=Curtobacterium sp. 9128 TaxID=1793722 RepID=UPI0007D722CC|nr:hypothetical protein [Curtobacterium sp. 9128]SBN63024.1 hypothetical protein GA0004736_1943 [Curtobacterium sp. 9128]